MNGARILILGAGYSARAFARANPGGTEIAGTTRTPEKRTALSAAGISPLLFADGQVGPDLDATLARATHLVVSAAPGEAGDPMLVALGERLRAGLPSLGWIGYLSTVGVYGDHGGAWIDETAACRPVSRRSVQRVAAEQQWLRLGEAARLPVAVLRLAGIYGPGRNAFVNLANGTARRLVKPGQVFNRIHVDDIAGALWHLAAARLGGLWNVADDEPAPPQDVVAYAAELMGLPPPPETDFATAELSPMARSFYGENKRVSNARLKAAGYAFLFPDYRTGLELLWAEGRWDGAGGADGRSPMGGGE